MYILCDYDQSRRLDRQNNGSSNIIEVSNICTMLPICETQGFKSAKISYWSLKTLLKTPKYSLKIFSGLYGNNCIF